MIRCITTRAERIPASLRAGVFVCVCVQFRVCVRERAKVCACMFMCTLTPIEREEGGVVEGGRFWGGGWRERGSLSFSLPVSLPQAHTGAHTNTPHIHTSMHATKQRQRESVREK